MNLSTLFTLSFAFLSIVSTFVRAADPVRDYNGDPVEAGFLYELWGVGYNKGAIAVGGAVDGSDCIFNVINHPYDPNNTLIPEPVALFGANDSDSLVRVGQDYNILFGRYSNRPCNVWQVNLKIGSTDHNFITTGGQSGLPGCPNINAWFQLELLNGFEHLYKIIANPQVCHDNRHCPEEIYWIEQDGAIRLYLDQRQYLKTKDHEAIVVRFGKKLRALSLSDASE